MATETLESGAAPRQESPTPAPAAPAPPMLGDVRPNTLAIVIGAALALLGLLVCGFAVYLYGLSGVVEAREQSVLYKTFAGQLSQATAPVGPTPDSSGTASGGSASVQYITEGAPVALLDIPRLGISGLVVVEGTKAEDTMRGPGHVRTSALPGQAGVSVLYGRVGTFGAPFAHLMRLNQGDIIKATTGQGRSTYKVASFGTKDSPPPDPTANRLELVTGNSSLLSDGAVIVSADLVGAPQQNPGGWPAITPQETPLAGDPGALLPLTLWSQVLLLIAVGGVVAANRWARWPAFLCAAPAAIAVALAVYENAAALLPNLT